MADVTGPISTLPGAAHSVPDNVVCDTHQDRVATHRVQGETDSFGSEMHDMCDQCLEEYRAQIKAYQESEEESYCDWCKAWKPNKLIQPRRDPDEGQAGPVYQVCDVCKAQAQKRDAEEHEWWLEDNEPDDYDDEPYDFGDEWLDPEEDEPEPADLYGDDPSDPRHPEHTLWLRDMEDEDPAPCSVM